MHIFTASGAALALFALLAAIERDWALMFLLLGVALFVDGVDGTIARRLDVAERAAALVRRRARSGGRFPHLRVHAGLSSWSASGLLPRARWRFRCAIAIVISGALYFADREMKTADNYFRGFPAVWNVPAFYLFLLRPDPWIAAAAIALLAVLTFLPVPFVHPFRVARLRALNVAAAGRLGGARRHRAVRAT